MTPCMYIFLTIYDSAPGMRRGWAKTYAAPLLHIQLRRRRSRFKDLTFLAFFGTWKKQLLPFLCGNGFLFQVMVNQYYVVYRNILQSILPAVIVLFIGDHYWSFIHFLNLEGPLSDRYGRIPALLFSLGMNCLCYTGDRKTPNPQVNVKEKFTAWPKASCCMLISSWL